MAILTREQILGVDDCQKLTINTKEWGGDVIVRQLNADEREKFEAFAVGKPESGIQALLLAMCLIDETGKNIFTTDDVKLLGTKSGKPVAKVFKAAMKLNALTEEDVKELEKN